MKKSKLKLFVFSDDVEQILISAYDREDAFNVVEEQFGDEAADELIISKLYEYPNNFAMSGSFDAKASDIAQDQGRGIILNCDPHRIPLPESQKV